MINRARITSTVLDFDRLQCNITTHLIFQSYEFGRTSIYSTKYELNNPSVERDGLQCADTILAQPDGNS